MSLPKIQVDDIGNVLSELERAFFDIPFENSDFQNRAFVMAAQQTPARAYRALGLRMFSKIQAVKTFLFEDERRKIDIEEKESRLADPDLSEFDRRRINLDLVQLQDGESWNRKLLSDAVHELSLLYAEFKKFPKYTREAFEAEEAVHFKVRLTRQAQLPGPMESMAAMEHDLPNWDALLSSATEALKLTNQR